MLPFLFCRILCVCLSKCVCVCVSIIPPWPQDLSSWYPEKKKVVLTVAKIEFLFNLYGFLVRRPFYGRVGVRSGPVPSSPPPPLASLPLILANTSALEPTQLPIPRQPFWNLFHIIVVPRRLPSSLGFPRFCLQCKLALLGIVFGVAKLLLRAGGGCWLPQLQSI